MPMNCRWMAAAALTVALGGAALAGELTVPKIFSDRAVLLRGEKTPVFGKADPGAAVTVTLGSASAKAVAGKDGRWLATLDLRQSPEGPFELTVAADGKTLAFKDVLVGEVWLCSGQSNMEFSVRGAAGGKEEAALPENPRLRHFKVRNTAKEEPVDTLEGSWQIAGPQTTGGFTAVGYFFGKEIAQTLNVPVGLLNSSWGGTLVEAWTSPEANDTLPESRRLAAERRESIAGYDGKVDAYLGKIAAWRKECDREDRPADPAARTAPPAEWQPLPLPGPLPGNGGALLIKRTVDVPKRLEGKRTEFYFGIANTPCEVFWNGKSIGRSGEKEAVVGAVSRFPVPADQVKEGPAEVVIRFFLAAPGVRTQHDPTFGGIRLTDGWSCRYEFALPALSAAARKAMPGHPGQRPRPQNVPGAIYNAMIHPLLPYGLRGILWYQGESNAGKPDYYREAFPLMVSDWRARFAQGDLPFYFCQLPNYKAKTDQAGAKGEWAEFRDAQAAALKLLNTGQAVIIDVGEAGDIHPLDKKTVGHRLALLALADTYGRKDTVASGPVCVAAAREGGKLRLKFANANGGLVARPLPATHVLRGAANTTELLKRNSPDSELEGFAVAGADGQWVWANARIDHDGVMVWSDKVAEPRQARYAWSDNPTCNLYNGAGLPAGPFRAEVP